MATTQTTNFTVRLDNNVKNEAEKLFSDLGLTLSSAVNIFLRQALIVQGLPFSVRREIPNRKTLSAMKEAIELANDPDARKFSSVKDLMREFDE